jgi:membrane protein
MKIFNIFRKIFKNPKVSNFLEITKRHFSGSDMNMTSIVAAYYFLLSLFPLLIAVGNLLPYLKINPSLVLSYMKQALPNDIFQMLKSVTRKLLTQRSGGLLSISALATLWTASQGVNALQSGINRAYEVDKGRNFLQNRIVGFLVMLLLVFVLVVAMVTFNFGQNLIDYLQKSLKLDVNFLENVHNWTLISAVVGIFTLLFVMYYSIPNVKIAQKRYLLPGAFLATAGLLFLSRVFGWYAKYFTTKVSEYQIIGSVIILMFWMVYASRILIAGSVVNLIFMEYFTGRELVARDQKMQLWLKNKVDKIKRKKADDKEER